MMSLFKSAESEIFTAAICCDWLANGRGCLGIALQSSVIERIWLGRRFFFFFPSSADNYTHSPPFFYFYNVLFFFYPPLGSELWRLQKQHVGQSILRSALIPYRVFIRWFNPRVSGCSPEESQLSWPGRCRAVRSGKLKRSGTTNAQRTAGVASDILQYAQYRERWCRCTCATPRYEGTPQNMTWISSFGLFLNSLLVVF